MTGKVAGLARALAVVLAFVAAFVAVPNLNVAFVLVILGLIAGLGYTEETATRLILAVLVLPAVAGALGAIPAIGIQLGAVAANIALVAAGAAGTLLAIRVFNLVRGDIVRLFSSSSEQTTDAQSSI